MSPHQPKSIISQWLDQSLLYSKAVTVLVTLLGLPAQYVEGTHVCESFYPGSRHKSFPAQPADATHSCPSCNNCDAKGVVRTAADHDESYESPRLIAGNAALIGISDPVSMQVYGGGHLISTLPHSQPLFQQPAGCFCGVSIKTCPDCCGGRT